MEPFDFNSDYLFSDELQKEIKITMSQNNDSSNVKKSKEINKEKDKDKTTNENQNKDKKSKDKEKDKSKEKNKKDKTKEITTDDKSKKEKKKLNKDNNMIEEQTIILEQYALLTFAKIVCADSKSLVIGSKLDSADLEADRCRLAFSGFLCVCVCVCVCQKAKQSKTNKPCLKLRENQALFLYELLLVFEIK